MLPTSPTAVDLAGRTLIKLSGSDRMRYLQGQITNDLSLLPARGTLEACVCNAKGKLEAHIFIRERTEVVKKTDSEGALVTEKQSFYLIDADPVLREDDVLLNRLNKYIIADDCEAEDVSDQYHIVHLIGTSAAPGETGIACNRFGPAGLDLIYSRLHDRFAFDHPLSLPGDLESLRISHGIPKWHTELTPVILPPEAGPEFVERNISYTKGCYIGQEVISRMRSAGKVNKQLVALRAIDTGAPLQPGLELFTESPEKPVAVGILTSCAANPAIALGYVKTAHNTPGKRLTAGTEDTPLAFPVEISKSPLILQDSEP